MSQSQLPDSGLSGFQEPDTIEYQAISGMAVAGLLVGILGLAALVWPQLWVVPAAGVVLAVAALRRVAQYAPALTGRNLALIGLLLSVLSATGAAAHWFGYRWLICREARQFADLWIDSLRNDEPVKAYQLAQDPRYRRPLDEFTAECFDRRSELCSGLKSYVARPVVRVLLALGEKAQVEYYQNESQFYGSKYYMISDNYAVTYQDESETKTFFIKLSLVRYRLPGIGQADWYISKVKGGIRPEGM